MPITGLMSETVQVMKRSILGEDSSGIETVEFLPGEIVSAFVVHRGAQEALGGRDQPLAPWVFLLDVESGVGPYDRLSYQGRTFEVTGLPEDAIQSGGGVVFTRVSAAWREG